jgi:hypothetical protein
MEVYVHCPPPTLTEKKNMIKKISMMALAGILTLPSSAVLAGSGKGPQSSLAAEDINQKIEALYQELDTLKAQLAQQEEKLEGTVEGMEAEVQGIRSTVAGWEKKSAAWDWAARFKLSGDFRSRFDAYQATGAEFLHPQTGQVQQYDYRNDSLLSNRLRLNMDVKATENMVFKSRLAMYKMWGMQGYPRNDMQSWWPLFDGNSTRSPSDNALRVDRAFINWTNIADLPLWFSIGRRPTTDGVPAQVRLGVDKNLATPTAYMDYPFDGAVIGYEYEWGHAALGRGRIRYCYGRGFEGGLQHDPLFAQDLAPLDDTDFTGLSWDVFEHEDRFFYIQSFVALNMFQRPSFQEPLFNIWADQNIGTNYTDGKVYHTTAVYQNRVHAFTYFLSGGWSRSDPGQQGLFNDYANALLVQADGSLGPHPQWRPNSAAENGYSLYAGIRYDIPKLGLKIGAEYNWGSQYWLAFSPGHDDLYLSKLATRGQVAELYLIYDLPTGKALSSLAKTFVRLGYQHSWYTHTGVDWNSKPYEVKDPGAMTAALMMANQSQSLVPLESAQQLYLTLDVFF